MVVLLSGCNQLFVERNQVVSAAHQVSAKEAERLVDEIRSAKDRAWWKTAEGNDRVDRGVLLLASGQVVRFGFVSHHVSMDHESHTVFEAEGYRRFVTGYFCCEVEFGQMPQPADLQGLDNILGEIDGVSP